MRGQQRARVRCFRVLHLRCKRVHVVPTKSYRTRPRTLIMGNHKICRRCAMPCPGIAFSMFVTERGLALLPIGRVLPDFPGDK